MGTFYIQKPELAYVHIPRTGMAMKNFINYQLKSNFDLIDDEEWMIDHPHIEVVKKHFPRALTFTVIRNPWQRIYSFYRKIKTEGYWLDWNRTSTLELKPINEWVIDYCNPHTQFKFPRWFNRFTNQFDFLFVNSQQVDFICKAENLNDDLKPILEYLEVHEQMEITDKSDHWEFVNIFNSNSIKLIAKLHEKDIDTFKYSLP